MAYEIRNPELWRDGELKIEWVAAHMPLLSALKKEFEEKKPFKGLKIALSVHLEAKTAYLCKTLAAGGAEMFVTGSNPLSTQDDIAAALAHDSLNVFAWYDATDEEYDHHITKVIEAGPNIIVDDGGDLVSKIHNCFPELLGNVMGGCEETTTGILRLNAMNKARKLAFPMILVNDASCKHLFDNRYGTGQSVWNGINRTTNLIVAGKTAVVAGYGWCGKGVAMRAKGLGAKVIVTEVDPVKAIEAVMDGFEVMPMRQAAPLGDIFITVTGCEDVINVADFFDYYAFYAPAGTKWTKKDDNIFGIQAPKGGSERIGQKNDCARIVQSQRIEESDIGVDAAHRDIANSGKQSCSGLGRNAARAKRRITGRKFDAENRRERKRIVGIARRI